MAEDEIVELIWHNGQIVRRSQTQRPTSDKPSSSSILRGSGSGGGGEGNAPPPQPLDHNRNLFIQEEEMASWLQHPHFYSEPLYSGVLSATHPQSTVSLAQPPLISAPYYPSTETPMDQIIAARMAQNFMRGNIFEAGPLIPVMRESMQLGLSATPPSSAHGTSTQATIISGVTQSFAVPSLGRKEKAVAIDTICDIAGTSSSEVCKADTNPIQIQPATETEIAGERKRKEREETTDKTEETEAAGCSTSRKRSRAAELHNISERRRREKINEKMKTLQELIPRCNKTDKASMLDDAIEYVKALQMQIQI